MKHFQVIWYSQCFTFFIFIYNIVQPTMQPSISAFYATKCSTNKSTDKATIQTTYTSRRQPTSKFFWVQQCSTFVKPFVVHLMLWWIFLFNSYDHECSSIMWCMIYLLTFLRILFNFLYFGSSVLTRVSSTYGDRVKWTTMDATLKPLLVHWCFAGQQRMLAAIAIRLALAETFRLHCGILGWLFI